MPVATQGSLKGLTPEQLEATGCRICLNNTYHLYIMIKSVQLAILRTDSVKRGLRPGKSILDKIGGAHRLQSWPHNILTGVSYVRRRGVRC